MFQHYENDADGLCTQLVRPLPRPAGSDNTDGDSDFDVKKLFKDNGWVINRKDLKVSVIGFYFANFP